MGAHDYEILFLLLILGILSISMVIIGLKSISANKQVTQRGYDAISSMMTQNIRLTEHIVLLKDKINLLNEDLKQISYEKSLLENEIQKLSSEVIKLQSKIENSP